MKKKLILLSVIISFASLGTIRSQELPAPSETVNSTTVEAEAVEIGQAIDEVISDETDADALQEIIAEELLQKKLCEAAAAERYASTIRCINDLADSAEMKRAKRESARACFLSALESCRTGLIIHCMEICSGGK